MLNNNNFERSMQCQEIHHHQPYRNEAGRTLTEYYQPFNYEVLKMNPLDSDTTTTEATADIAAMTPTTPRSHA